MKRPRLKNPLFALRWTRQGVRRGRPRPRLSQAGFTLIELFIVILILSLLILVGLRELRRPREQALLASCIAFHEAINRSLWAEYAKDGEFPNTLDGIIDNMDAWALSVEFAYAGGEDFNKGHGNDWDEHDQDNPGNKEDTSGESAGYYLRCKHDHSYIKVLFVDSGAYIPPKAIYNEADARGEEPK